MAQCLYQTYQSSHLVHWKREKTMSLRDKIEKGKFIVTAELGPPQSANTQVILKKVDYFLLMQ